MTILDRTIDGHKIKAELDKDGNLYVYYPGTSHAMGLYIGPKRARDRWKSVDQAIEANHDDILKRYLRERRKRDHAWFR